MSINVGDKIPSVTLKQLTPEGVKEVTTDEIFGGKKVILFAVPGAFTPACSQRHLPGFVERAADIKAKGVDEIACVAVNDAFVMGAWGREQKTEGKVRMLADGSGDLVGTGFRDDGLPCGKFCRVLFQSPPAAIRPPGLAHCEGRQPALCGKADRQLSRPGTVRLRP